MNSQVSGNSQRWAAIVELATLIKKKKIENDNFQMYASFSTDIKTQE